ncbi:MAG: cyclohexa-1,5-dienecarbonyl-CoA hydratase [Proteobacteria bacterium]|nr:cyclohexa-1,5-dienecarbonyl-CoA hydratase [Pseudomonadota bacterium]
MSEAPCKVWLERENKLLRLRLNRPKANIVDAAMIAALQEAFNQYAGNTALRGVLLDAEGPHFSFGASVEEHLPGSFAAMLRALHLLVESMLDFPVPILVAIRGQCLGGGLEVVCAASQLFASPDAAMGQPEIQLAVFAPAASCLLPERIGRGQAEDLLFSGRSIKAEEALSMGLINAIAENPENAALDYFDKHLAPRSASSLRFAVQAVRGDLSSGIKARLAEVEALYTEGLMSTHDAVEGLTAFIEKRPASWEDK